MFFCKAVKSIKKTKNYSSDPKQGRPQVVEPPPKPVKNGGQSEETITKRVYYFKKPEVTMIDSIYNICSSINT